MSIHDWTRVDSGTFHDFHQSWTLTLRNALNDGVLPDGYFAMVEQRIAGPIADVLALELAKSAENLAEDSDGGLAVAVAPPRAQLTLRSDPEVYADKANRVTVRHRHGKVVAVVEIVSPGNKHSSGEFRAFVEKSAELIRQGIHLLVIDLFPPTPRDPSGLAKAIWDQFGDESIDLPPGKRLTISSVDAANRMMYVNFVGVGEEPPAVPLFIRQGRYVPAPLAASYQEAWRSFPTPLKRLVE
jgi:hypothetical protein